MAKQNVDVLIRARDQASGQLRSVMKSLVRFGAAFIGVRQGLRLVRGSVDAWQVQQDAVNSLRASLTLLGREMQLPQMTAFAARLQKMTKIGDETTLQMMTLGSQIAGLAGQDLEQATVAAIGLSKSLGINLQASMRLVARAAIGDTASLKRQGVVLDETADATGKYNELLAMGRERFAMATAETETFSGRLAMLKNAIGDAREQLGRMIVEHQGLSDAMVFARTIIENFATTAQLVWTELRLAFAAFSGSIVHALTVRIPAYLDWFADNWRNIFQTLWNGTKAVFTNMWENIKSFFFGVWSYLRGDGFSFEWTGLLDGFESTLKQLPQIAERELTGLERQLMDRRDELAATLGQALAENITGTTLGEFGKAALSAAGGPTATAGKGVAAVESRFLSGASVGANYEQETAKNTQRQVKLLERLVARAEKQEAFEAARNAAALQAANFV